MAKNIFIEFSEWKDFLINKKGRVAQMIIENFGMEVDLDKFDLIKNTQITYTVPNYVPMNLVNNNNVNEEFVVFVDIDCEKIALTETEIDESLIRRYLS